MRNPDITLPDWKARAEQAEARLTEACDRIRDLLEGDDGQAYSEAERFLERIQPR